VKNIYFYVDWLIDILSLITEFDPKKFYGQIIMEKIGYKIIVSDKAQFTGALEAAIIGAQRL
jgi:hypothetical protein